MDETKLTDGPIETIPEAEDHFVSTLGFEGSAESLATMLSMPSVAFEILSESYRRHIITYLMTHETPVAIHDLATYVAARERRTSRAAVTPGERDEVAARLIHVHLPKLVDFGIIEWIPERGEILLYSGVQGGTEQHGKEGRTRPETAGESTTRRHS